MGPRRVGVQKVEGGEEEKGKKVNRKSIKFVPSSGRTGVA